MGDFRFVLEASGGHGCQRELGDGKEVHGCLNLHCPDCLSRIFTQFLKDLGVNVHKAELTHWPHDIILPEGVSHNYKEDDEVKDNLLTKVRTGSFK